MKAILWIALIFSLIFSACTKYPAVRTEEKSFPYAKNGFSMTVASETVPDHARFIHFLDQNTGFLITHGAQSNSKIYKTTDKGKTWNVKYAHTNADQPLSEILFTSNNVGYAIGGNSGCGGTGCIPPGAILLKTTDAGESWNVIYQLTGAVDFKGIAANSLGELFILKAAEADKTHLVTSVDGGIHWAQIKTFNGYLNKIIFHNDHGYLTGRDQSALIIRSNDLGHTWNDTYTFAESGISDISFAANTGYCLLENKVYSTTDQGNNWNLVLPNPTYVSTKLNALSDETCLLWGMEANYVGCFGVPDCVFNHTNDGGNVWTTDVLKEISTINSSSFYSDTEGYILSGKLIHIKREKQ